MFEILLAVSIFLFSIGGILFAMRSLERHIISENLRLEAKRYAKSEIDRAYLLLRDDFDRSEIEGFDTDRLDSDIQILYENEASKIIKGIVSFNLFGNDRDVSLWRRITKPEYGLGKSTCSDAFSTTTIQNFNMYQPQAISFGAGNIPTDIDVVGDFLYLSADGSLASLSDLFIFDVSNPLNPVLKSSLNTGPGISAIHVVKNVVYAANQSINAQLQVISTENLNTPSLIRNIKLPGIYTDGTVVGRKVLYDSGKVYLGTEKNSINELHIFSVEDLTNPIWKSSYEIGAGINSFAAEKKFLYLASPSNPELFKFDVSEATNPTLLATFNASTGLGNGKSLARYDEDLLFGRTVGNKEIYLLKDMEVKSSMSVGASVDDVILKKDLVFAMTSKLSDFFQIYRTNASSSTGTLERFGPRFSFNSRTIALDCDKKSFFILTSDPLNPYLLIK